MWKLKHANSILESLEYFCQISSKLILIIFSYTISKLVHLLRHSVQWRRREVEYHPTPSHSSSHLSRGWTGLSRTPDRVGSSPPCTDNIGAIAECRWLGPRQCCVLFNENTGLWVTDRQTNVMWQRRTMNSIALKCRRTNTFSAVICEHW